MDNNDNCLCDACLCEDYLFCENGNYNSIAADQAWENENSYERDD